MASPIERYITLIGSIIAILTFIITIIITIKKTLNTREWRKIFISYGFSNETFNNLRFYVPPTIKRITNRKYINQDKSIHTEMINENDKRIIFLTGEAGVGKSMFFAYIAKFSKNLNYTPKRIIYCSSGLQDIKGIQNKNGTLLLIDSIDENSNIDVNNFINNQLTELNAFGKIIIAVRKLDSDIQTEVMNSREIDLFQIEPFDNYRIFKYLILKFTFSIYKLVNSYFTINKNIELFRIPFFLNFVGEISLKNTINLNKNDVYEKVIFSTLEKNNIVSDKYKFEEFFENVAWLMFDTNKNYISLDTYQNLANSVGINLIPQNLKIVYLVEKQIQFIHYTFYEYYLSKKLIRNSHLVEKVLDNIKSTNNVLEFVKGEKINFFKNLSGRYVQEESYESFAINSSFDFKILDKIEKLLIRYRTTDFYKIEILNEMISLSVIYLIHEIYSPDLYKLVFYMYSNRESDLLLENKLDTGCREYIKTHLINKVPETLNGLKSLGNLKHIGIITWIEAFFDSQVNYIIKNNNIVSISKEYDLIKSISINSYNLKENEIKNVNYFILEIIKIEKKLKKSIDIYLM